MQWVPTRKGNANRAQKSEKNVKDLVQSDDSVQKWETQLSITHFT